MTALLELSRAQILGHRRRAGSLDERLPAGAESLRRAAWAGLQDSMPRAALLSIHARVEGTEPNGWEHAALRQLWGPRYSNYVVAAKDVAIFSLGRLTEHDGGQKRASETATRLRAFLRGRRMPCEELGHAMRVNPNSLRYAAPTGTVLIHWDGARQPTVWCVAAPEMDAREARLELARRYLHIFGPSTEVSFARWAGMRPGEARNAFAALAGELTAVRTPLGNAWILSSDEGSFRAMLGRTAATRLLPSGDTHFLLWGADRELLVPQPEHRTMLWTSRVWPGALLIGGEIAGVWRRAGAEVSIEPWRRLSKKVKEAVEEEAASLPLPGLNEHIRVKWIA
ncbi:MAG TPA: crosslink repair DNA glycosylase YcaQ family protein [Dongiaceae bacterium]|nr:crosslink repair DNA glycosylase YcaQ family protein [Dongiaceae bacterium]